ncbi:Uncharacterised protein [Bordetella pertussis]|nr:Uncharacterised protein [Bordetella pertussis]CFW47616.1 Uncharacterised protein [Bordetella pertussis]
MGGSAHTPSARPSRPSGTLIRNSQCQLPRLRISEAAVGPAASDRLTTSAFRPRPRPSCSRG